MSNVATMTLVIDIAVLLDEGETDTSWVLAEVGKREQELILGGYRFDITRIEEQASSATETENDTACAMVFDGTDTDGSVWNRCTVHNRLVFGDAPVCEGYRAPEYVER